MENHGNMERQEGVTNDIILEWINSDKNLRDALAEIRSICNSEKEQAEMAFHKISDLYGLPKNSDDMPSHDDEFEEEEEPEDEYYDPMPVYRELGLIKYLDPDNDPLSQVLMAIYCVKNRYNVDSEAAYQKCRNSGKKCLGIGYRGNNSGVEIIFIDGSKSWLELGCKLYERPA